MNTSWNDIIELERNMPLQLSKITKIAEEIVKIAYEEYHYEHPGQSFARIHERGGFSQFEVITLLYMRILRLKEEK